MPVILSSIRAGQALIIETVHNDLVAHTFLRLKPGRGHKVFKERAHLGGSVEMRLLLSVTRDANFNRQALWLS